MRLGVAEAEGARPRLIDADGVPRPSPSLLPFPSSEGARGDGRTYGERGTRMPPPPDAPPRVLPELPGVESGGRMALRGVAGGRIVPLEVPLCRAGVADLPASSRRPCAFVAGQLSRPGVLGIGVAADPIDAEP